MQFFKNLTFKFKWTTKKSLSRGRKPQKQIEEKQREIRGNKDNAGSRIKFSKEL